VTVLDTFASSHLPATLLAAGAASEKAALLKIEFNTELGNRLKLVTGEKLKLTYLFQRLSIAIQRGNELCFNGTFVPR